MPPSLPIRSRPRNRASATAAPAAFSLVASLNLDADHAEPILRSELDVPIAAAERHARFVLASLVARAGAGVAFSVVLLDGSNAPVFTCSSNGGAL